MQYLPTRTVEFVRNGCEMLLAERRKRLPLLTEKALRDVLINDLGLNCGDVIFVHTSINKLNLAFPFFQILHMLQEIVGKEGTLLFPTYPKLASYAYLSSGEIFDVRKSPSYSGVLTELARRQRNSIRSLHPTKSVCAIGPRAEFLTKSHQNSPYPYDSCSPYYKLIDEKGAKIIGLGVTTHNLSFVHCVDDALKETFPIQPYHSRLFQAHCIGYSGGVELVSTFAHNLKAVRHNIPIYIKRYIPRDVCEDVTRYGVKFFHGKAKDLFDLMVDLANNNITIYNQKFFIKRHSL
jgi:aminoglycoside 3-N-acetyltransferase